MDSLNKHEQIIKKIAILILEFVPEISLFLNFRALNTNLRSAIQQGSQRELWHKNMGKVKQHFLLNIYKRFDTTNLKALNFEFSAVNDNHFGYALQNGVDLSKLVEINLNAAREISDKTVVQIASHCQNLERIELYWNCRINDFCLKKLAKSCKKLNFVNLSGCKHLSDSSIAVLVDNCKQITHLNLTRLPKLTEDGMASISKANLDLTYLNFYASTSISDQGFQSLATSMHHNLLFLDLCGCKDILDDTVVKLCESFPLLEYLVLTWCVSLNDKAVVEGVAKYLTKLELLSLYGLVRITDASVDALVASPNRLTLKTLDINGCCLVTDGDDKGIRKRFPNVVTTVWHS